MAEQSLPTLPTLRGLLPLVRQTSEYTRLAVAAQGTQEGPRAALPPAMLAPLAAALHSDGSWLASRSSTSAPSRRPAASRPPLLIVVPRAEEAKRLRDELSLWLPDPSQAMHYPEPEALPYERIAGDSAVGRQRLAVLAALRAARGAQSGATAPLVVTSVRGLLSATIAPADLLAGGGVLQRGMAVDLQEMLKCWLDLGYEPVTVVEDAGQFSRRGGIIDIYPPSSEQPVRVELFGDEIDSVRFFDPVTQRSLGPARSVTVAAPSEVLPQMAAAAAEALATLAVSNLNPAALETWQADLERLRAGQAGGGLDFYAPFFSDELWTLADHFAGVVLLDSPDLLADTATGLHQQAEAFKAQLVERGELPSGFRRPYRLWEEVTPPGALVGSRIVALEPPGEVSSAAGSGYQAPPIYAGRLKQLLDDCLALAQAGERVVLTSHQARRLSALLAERGRTSLPVAAIEDMPPPGSLTIVQGSATEGWSAAGLTVLSDAEIFGWVRPRRSARRVRTARDLLLSDLRPGDYVVHIEHGVGVFRGLEKLALEGNEKEYLHLDYAEGDRLFVPADHIDRVSRYVGAGDARPSLTRLSSADWEHVKTRVKKAVQNIAKELLALYAARESAQGYSFGPDTVWQGDLEASFPYIETADQLTAIEDVKEDMERRRPMDRLICGDVGYGKTEVALRAAFKAVMDGKQVGILVPTTILAQQHFNTFTERLAAYPVRVEMLSRFRSEKEQHRALEGLRDGTVDIVIGTHRLLQKDVAFKDLGLVVIDEEQRFGVAHKERLKQLRKEVDVLTLTATPIPRTLHMSLAGVRDMSTIETPPEDRLPIVTMVRAYDDAIVREAILRERDRGGQVYFVHNRVHGIETIATRLKNLVPEASFIVGHGQMQEEQLEKVMLDFGEGRYDVLVCTAIIEAGLDIPNVNTILINRANHFGLSQLYQLRGRVGRGANRAYAYFLYDNEYQLSNTAEKRLDVIRDATDLGAGFRVAMKDLEIRGAGNLLGAEQHGHIAAVGFELYTKLLAEAVAELKELESEAQEPEQAAREKAAPPPAPSLELPLDAYLPPDYVAADAERLVLYQRMAALQTPEEVEFLATELRDRFGPPPPAAESLLYSLRVKVRAAAAVVTSIRVGDDAVVVRLGSGALPDRAGLAKRFGPALRQPGLHTLRLERAKLGGKWREPLLRLVTVLAGQREAALPAG